MLEIKMHVCRGFSCNTYFCRDTESKKLLVIDPGVRAEEILELLGDTRPEIILLTHGHFDHVAAADKVRAATGAPVAVHRLEAELLEDPWKNASARLSRKPVRFSADRLLEDGDEIRLGASKLRVLHTPGHSLGSASYFGEGYLFCGDTLFCEGFGRTDLFGGNDAALVQSIDRLFHLPASTEVCPGHDASFRLSRRIAQMPLI